MKNNLKETVKKTIKNNNLLSANDAVLIAVSGGADSVCLFDVLFSLKDELNLKLYVAHLNHLLRGDEANRDEEFVRSICEKKGVPFFCERKDVLKLSKETGTSIEEAGRNARYDFFSKLKTEHEIHKIATAHNKNDNVETVCMRIMRGTGIHGLTGIPIENDLSVIRPLLYVSREEIEKYLEEKNLSFITDSSNLEDDYARNKVRHHLIPYIEENHNESFIDTFSQNIELFTEAEHYLYHQTEKSFDSLVIKKHFGFEFDLEKLKQEDKYIIKSVLRMAFLKLSNKEMPQNLVLKVYDALVSDSDSIISASVNLDIYIKYDKLYFVIKKDALSFEYEKLDDNIFINEINAKLSFEKSFEKPNFSDKNVIHIKSPHKKGTFKVRNRKRGDTIYLGDLGHKKVKDLLIDEKIPVFLRDEIPILLYDDEIIWVPGIRDNPKYRSNDSNEHIKITFTKEN